MCANQPSGRASRRTRQPVLLASQVNSGPCFPPFVFSRAYERGTLSSGNAEMRLVFRSRARFACPSETFNESSPQHDGVKHIFRASLRTAGMPPPRHVESRMICNLHPWVLCFVYSGWSTHDTPRGVDWCPNQVVRKTTNTPVIHAAVEGLRTILKHGSSCYMLFRSVAASALAGDVPSHPLICYAHERTGKQTI